MAFERIEWSFIGQALHFFNFPQALANSSFPVFLHPLYPFLLMVPSLILLNLPREIRQGDPISPYLFILCMELLSKRIKHEVDLLNWTLIFISRERLKIFHLFFADDLILLTKANNKNYLTIRNTLTIFSSFSGQKNQQEQI